VPWYRKAAEQGNANAMYNLGTMYGLGRGVAKDAIEAHKWFNLAAARADADTLKSFAATRDALAKSMPPDQLATAQKRASEWSAAFKKRVK
jgi:hypothetical protein